MAFDPVPATVSPKTRYVVTLLTGTSWTVPAGVTYVNAKLIGGGGGGAGGSAAADGAKGLPGQIVETTVATTPGASISYAIGAGGVGGSSGGVGGSNGGNTTFTGAATANGGLGAAGSASGATGNAGTAGIGADNGGQGSALNSPGGTAGQGEIVLEYYL